MSATPIKLQVLAFLCLWFQGTSALAQVASPEPGWKGTLGAGLSSIAATVYVAISAFSVLLSAMASCGMSK